MEDTKEKKVSVKIPKELHDELKKQAKRDGKYVERVVADTLKEGLKKK